MAKKVEHLMAQGVVVATPEHTVDYVRRQILTLDIHAVPVADASGRPLGIVRSRDLLRSGNPETPVSEVMCRELVTVDRAAAAEVAAQLMQSHRLRQLVVVDGDKIVGIVSAFDLLAMLVEGPSEFSTGVIDLRALRSELPD